MVSNIAFEEAPARKMKVSFRTLGATPILQEIDPVYLKLYSDAINVDKAVLDEQGIARYQKNETYLLRDPPTGHNDQVLPL